MLFGDFLHPEHKTDSKNEEKPEHCAQENHGEKSRELEQKISELTGTLKQVQADFENYKKRIEKNQEEFAKFSSAKTIAELLPVLDSFDSAIEKMKNSENFTREKSIEGLILLKKQFDDYLHSQGLQEIDAEGKIFDPHIHEIISRGTDRSRSENIVLEVFQKGYLIHGRLLRPVRVRINQHEKNENELHK